MEQTPLTIALQRIEAGEFEVPYPQRTLRLYRNGEERDKDAQAVVDYREKCGEMRQNFRKMLAELYGVSDHPKEQKLFDLSWEEGHSSGYSEVALKYDEFVDLMK